MMVFRYLGGRKITGTELEKITITKNDNIRAVVDSVAARINNIEEKHGISTNPCSNSKECGKKHTGMID